MPEIKKLELSPSISIIIAGVIIAGAIYVSNNRPATAPVATTNTAQQAGPAVDVSQVKTAGEPFIGNVNAPLTIAYWYDYQCPFCRRHEEQTMPQLIKDYVDTGKAKIIFKDYQFLGPDSQTLGQFARAVWAVSPGKFYEWHKAVYDNQGTENTGWATQSKIFSITTSVLGASDTNKVATLVKTNGDAYQKEMDADKAEGTAFGVTGTPAMVIGKQLVSGAVPYAQFKTAVETALAGK